MTQLQSTAPPSGYERPLRVLMAVGAATAIGGLETSFARIAGELSATGVQASVLVVGAPASTGTSVAFLRQHLPTRTASGWHEVWRALTGSDVVHVHGATSALWPAIVVAAARLRGIPVVVTLHLPSHPARQPRLRGEIRSRARMVCRGLLLLVTGASVYAPSDAAAAVAQRQFRPWPVRVRGLWNGVVDPGCSPIPASGPLRLVFVGRLTDHKRPLEFVEAVVAASSAGADVTADIVGDGPLRPQVERAIADSAYSERFAMHGQCDTPTQVMRCCDLLVLTSMTEGGCPLVAMEAAGTGRGLLARVGIEGLAEGWDHAHIAVSDNAGSAGFAKQIVALAADRDAVVRLGATARMRYETRFSATHAAESLRAAYDGCRR